MAQALPADCGPKISCLQAGGGKKQVVSSKKQAKAASKKKAEKKWGLFSCRSMEGLELAADIGAWPAGTPLKTYLAATYGDEGVPADAPPIPIRGFKIETPPIISTPGFKA